MMLCLGQFVFSLSTASYQELQHRTSWKHPTQSRVGARDASQFVGAGEETITLNGSMVPEFAGDPESLDTCLLYTSPSPRDVEESRMPSSA